MTRILVSVFILLALPAGASPEDWSQWRGPLRNGVLPAGPALTGSWPTNGPPLLWESENIPGDDDGGHGSPLIVGSKVYLSLVWHTNVPSMTRTITELVMRELGYQGTGGLGKELVAEMETQRRSIDPQLRGKKLDEFIDQWIEQKLDAKQKQLYGGWVKGRFRKGQFAIPLEDYEKLLKVQDKPFATSDALTRWLDEQEFDSFVKDQVIKAVPPTSREAQDVVICLDLETGKTLWKAAAPGEPKGRGCSSTAAFSDGHVYAMGSGHIYSVDASNGKIRWSSPLPGKTPGSSPLVADGVVVANVSKLAGYDVATGKQLWLADKIGGGNASPVFWQTNNRSLAIINARKEITAVDIRTGEKVWQVPGGGDATPAISGNILTVQTGDPKIGMVALKLTSDGAEKLWNHPMDALRTQSSPVIVDEAVYLMDDNFHWCFALKTGEVHWKQSVPSNISSPIVADGKIFVMANYGNNIQMLQPSSEKRIELAKANVRVLWCPSPAVAHGRLVLRAANKLRCYKLTTG